MSNESAKNGAWDLVDHYLGPIRHLFNLPGVTEIMVNRFDRVFIEQHGAIKAVPEVVFEDENSVRMLVNQIGNALGQPVDSATHPVLDARLPNDTRVCGVLYPVSPGGTCVTFRVFPKVHITAKDLVEKGSLTQAMLELLQVAVICHCNMLISGGTGSGKTTLLNALSAFIPRAERVATAEDTRELRIDAEDHIALEAPTRRREGGIGQKVDLAFLIRTLLRKNPTRMIVGEIRDAAAATAFLHALNTGHTAWSTIHANNPVDALTRIQTLVAGQGDLPFEGVKAQVRSNLNLIVHAEKTPHQGRRIVSITEVIDGKPLELWRWSYRQGEHLKAAESTIHQRLGKYGLELPN
ncbi:ATPase, T2SS/T4P/T4SS family [Desulfosarcina cetonica]